MDLERIPPRTLIVVALIAGLSFQLLLGTSYVGASLDPLEAPATLPVALVIEDRGEHGLEFLARLREAGGPIDWTLVPTRVEAVRNLEAKDFLGAIVFPANFSESLDSFASDQPHAAHVEVITNSGASTSGSVIASRAIDIVLESLRTTVRERAIDSADTASLGKGALTLDQARFVAQPIEVQTTAVNPVPRGGAGGLAPVYLAMAAWIGGYLGSVALQRFAHVTNLTPGRRALVTSGAAIVQGGAAALLIEAVGLTVTDPLAFAFMLMLGTWMAYAVVSLLLDVLGLPGVVPAFAVLALGLPASGAIYPAAMLPAFHRALYGISPFTPLVEGLRTALYAPTAGDFAANASWLVGLTLGATALSILLALYRERGLRAAPAPS